MTIFQVSDIPTDIDTLEKLVCWSNFTLARLYPDVNITTTTSPDNGAPVIERAVQVGQFAVNTTNTQWVFLGRIGLELDTAWLEGGQPWQSVNELGAEAIPDNLKIAGGGTYSSGGAGGTASASGVRSITRAFSTRPINRGYNGAFVLVRRVSDNAFRKFASNSGSDWFSYDDPVDGLAVWLAGTTGTVNIWYDQSGRGEHATAPDQDDEPEIRLEEGMNYPYLYFDGAGDYFKFPEEIQSNLITGVVAEDPDADDKDRNILGHRTERDFPRGRAQQWFYVSSSNGVLVESRLTVNGQVVDGETAKPGTDWQIFTLETSADGAINQIGRDSTYSGYWHGKVAEILISRSAENFDASATYQNIYDNFFGVIPDDITDNTTDNTDDTNTDTGSDTADDTTDDTTNDTGTDTGSDTGTDTTPVTSYLLDDAGFVTAGFSVRKLVKNENNPIFKIQRGGDNLQRYFGEIGGSNSSVVWYAYDDPVDGLSAWLGNNVGYIQQWWHQGSRGIATVYGGRIVPNALGKYPSIWFNGQTSRIILSFEQGQSADWRSAHLVIKEDSTGAPEDGEIISGIPRGENRVWTLNDAQTIELLSGTTKIGGEVVDLTTELMPTTWKGHSFISSGFEECNALGCRGSWVQAYRLDGAPDGVKFETSNFWRGEVAEIILVNRLNVDLDAYYASAKEAFGLT